MTTHFCECEHAKHPSEDDATPEQRSQRNNPSHMYGMEPFDRSEMVEVKTQYGVYLICNACNHDHPIPEDYRV